MKKLTFLAITAILLVVGASTSSAKTFNWKDVRDMSEAGVPDDIIIQKINATDLVFELKADEIIDLWEAGVSEKVIQAMLQTEAPEDEQKGEEILDDQKGDKDEADKDDSGYDNRSDATPPSDSHSHVSIGLGFGFGYPLPYYSYYPYGYAYPYFGSSYYYPYVSHYHYYPYGGYYRYPYGGGGGGGSYTRQRTIVGPSTKGYYGYRSYSRGMVSAPRAGGFSGGFYRGGFSGGHMMRAGGFGGFRTR